MRVNDNSNYYQYIIDIIQLEKDPNQIWKFNFGGEDHSFK